MVGTDAESGDEITAQNGRYGPYLKKGTDSRSLTSEEQLFTITLDEALRIYAQPKQRGRAAAAPPLKELGNDPVSGQPVVVKAGRFGEYVTDGEYNATLRKDDSVESITLERAAELLAERRAKGPAKKAAKKAAKKPTQEGREEDGGEEDDQEGGRQEVLRDSGEASPASGRVPTGHGRPESCPPPRPDVSSCSGSSSWCWGSSSLDRGAAGRRHRRRQPAVTATTAPALLAG